MATNEELEKMIKTLQEQVNSLQDGFEKYQQLLAQEIDTIEQRLNAHDDTLNARVTDINHAEQSANNARIIADNAISGISSLQNALQNGSIVVKYAASLGNRIYFNGSRTIINSPLTINVEASSDQIVALEINVQSFGTPDNAQKSYYLLARDLGSGVSDRSIKA